MPESRDASNEPTYLYQIRFHVIDLAEIAQRFLDGEVGEERQLLGHVADAGAGNVAGAGARLLAEHLDGALVRREAAENASQQRRLAAAARAEQGVDAALRHRQVDLLQRHHRLLAAAVHEDDVAHLHGVSLLHADLDVARLHLHRHVLVNVVQVVDVGDGQTGQRQRWVLREVHRGEATKGG